MKSKIFVLDTSVIVDDPKSLHSFIGNKIVIPFAVYEEVDSFKKGNSSQSFAARNFFRILDRMVNSGKNLNSFSNLTENIQIKISNANIKLLPKEFDRSKRDNQIIATALNEIKKQKYSFFKEKFEIILVSKDAGLRILANSLNIKTEDYKAGKITNHDIFSDVIQKLNITDDQYDTLKTHRELFLTLPGSFQMHSRVIVNELECIISGKNIIQVLENNEVSGIKSKNKDQEYALKLLNNPKIQLVCLSGIAGSGKTLLALVSAVKQTIDMEKPIYKKIVIARPTVSVGREIGFLPGDLDEKLEPWMKPIYDALGIIMGDMDKTKIQYLFDSGIIEVAPISYIRGRSIHNAFIYIDESQNLNKGDVKTLLTRAGIKSKIVVAGDLDQIDVPYLDKYSCGLAHVINAFNGQEIFAHCHMSKSERSELAELSAKLL